MMTPMFDEIFVGGDAQIIASIGLAFFGAFAARTAANIIQKSASQAHFTIVCG